MSQSRQDLSANEELLFLFKLISDNLYYYKLIINKAEAIYNAQEVPTTRIIHLFNLSRTLDDKIDHIENLLYHISRDQYISYFKEQNTRLKKEKLELSKENSYYLLIIKKLRAILNKLNNERSGGEYQAQIDEYLSKIKKLEGKINSLSEKLSQSQNDSYITIHLQNQIQDLWDNNKQLNSQLQQALDEKSKLGANIEAARSYYKRSREEIVNLQGDLERKAAQIKRYQDELEERDKRLREKDDIIAELERRLGELEKGQGKGQEEKQEKAQEKVKAKPEEKAAGGIFDLPEVEAPLRGSLEDMRAFVQAVYKIDDLRNFLQQSSYPRAATYLKTLERHERDMEKLLHKLESSPDIDDDLLSEEISDRYFKLFAKNILGAMMVGIFHGLKEDPDFYKDFMKRLNAYLHRAGIYTRAVQSGSHVRDEDWGDMEVISAPTKDPALDKVIMAVERLPYYLNFINSYGEKEKTFHSGKMLLYNNKAGEQGNG